MKPAYAILAWLFSAAIPVLGQVKTTNTDDVTSHFPILSKGHLFSVRVVVPIARDDSVFLKQLLYSRKGEANIEGRGARFAESILSVELSGRTISIDDAIVGVLPFFHFCTSNFGSAVLDEEYLRTRSTESASLAYTLSQIRQLVHMPVAICSDSNWSLIYYTLEFSEKGAALVRVTVRGEQKLFRLSELKYEYLSHTFNVPPRL